MDMQLRLDMGTFRGVRLQISRLTTPRALHCNDSSSLCEALYLRHGDGEGGGEDWVDLSVVGGAAKEGKGTMGKRSRGRS